MNHVLFTRCIKDVSQGIHVETNWLDQQLFNSTCAVEMITYILHLSFEADVDFVAFGQCFLKLIKLLCVESQLWTDGKKRRSDGDNQLEMLKHTVIVCFWMNSFYC